MVSELWAHAPGLDPWHVLVSVSISNLDNEWNNTIAVLFSIVLNNKLGKDKGKISHCSKFSWPPLSSCDRWSVNHKFICLFIEGGSRLKASYV